MKYVQINSFYNGSTGAIMRRLHGQLKSEGHDSFIFWGRRHETISSYEQCCASKAGVYAHGARARITDRAGFYSKHDTKKLLAKLDEINPDVVHLHNIHGYYINIEMLFNWLEKRNQKTYWTLHDCWSFTGHCSHFSYVKCEQWRSCCSHEYKCPQKGEYPKSFLLDRSERNFEDKKLLFTSLPADKMTLIVPSRWLAGLVQQSFLSKYPVEVCHNEIDKMIFKPTSSDFRKRYDIGDRFMILGVASPWSSRKGLDDFLQLASALDSRFAIVLIGLTKKQIDASRARVRRLETSQSDVSRLLASALPHIIALAEGDFSVACQKSAYGAEAEGENACCLRLLGKTDSQRELAEAYSAADVFFNPTYEDNYPTVNLEAEACGTPVVTYDTGGCRETIALERSVAVTVV